MHYSRRTLPISFYIGPYRSKGWRVIICPSVYWQVAYSSLSSTVGSLSRSTSTSKGSDSRVLFIIRARLNAFRRGDISSLTLGIIFPRDSGRSWDEEDVFLVFFCWEYENSRRIIQGWVFNIMFRSSVHFLVPETNQLSPPSILLYLAWIPLGLVLFES